MSAMISSSSMASIPSPAGMFPGRPIKPTDRCLGSIRLTNVSLRSKRAGGLRLHSPKRLTIRAGYSDRSSSSSLFVSGFVLGGIIAGVLGCVYAPQISLAISGTDKKDLMRKLPKFIYDEDKSLERKRKKLTEKIAQLNTAIDGVSAQLRADDTGDDDVPHAEEVEVVA
ncbi:hypothetical protein MLD38_001857 [Melastoma candidum]|uniref:Uncharacterized protein n=1 Tax=Melastoma candidum TaxID=119954 RepID=A0ACB9SDX0_9MYRT|nr:hypothetical protein MLD38_001857 [Melastoma candidum]